MHCAVRSVLRLTALVLLGPVLWRCAGEPPAEAPRPNVVMVLVDTLRADALGAYGNRRVATPAFDAIAAEGVTFERALAQSPWTQPAVASLFSSFYPGVHKVTSYPRAFRAVYEDAPEVAVFDDGFATLAETLRDAGYATAAFVANPFLAAEFGFAQGFDHFDDSFAANSTPGDVVNAAALAWLDRRDDDDRPFLLYVHYMDVHGPYNAGPRHLDELLDAVERMPDKRRLSAAELDALDYLDRLPPEYTNPERHARLRPYREYWVARYEAGVREADEHLAALRRGLAERGLWQDSYVIVLSDHGEALCEHSLWDHGLSTYDTDLHVPLLLRWPDRLPERSRRAHTVRLIDVMPTVLDQLGLPPLAGAQGRSLRPYLDDERAAPDEPALAEGVTVGPEQQALYMDDWKLMVVPAEDRAQLFDRAGDPGELANVGAARPGEVRRLYDRLQRQLAANERLAAEIELQHKDLTPEQIERLRSLGYVR